MSRFQLFATYEIVSADAKRLVIRDVTLETGGRSVTNDAERVVAELAQHARDRRIFYYDTDGWLDELVHDRGRFTGFAPGSRE